MLALVAEGAAVGIAGRDEHALAKTAGAVDGLGGRALAVVGDVRSDTDVADSVSRVEAHFGGIDLVVHCAGVFRSGSVTDLTEDDWDVVIATNLKSCYLVGRHTVPALKRRGGGSIVNISSIAAFAGDAGGAAYSASKAGVNALTRIMALDHIGDRIRVNAVAPGNVRTPMLTSYAEEHYPDDPESMLAAAGDRHPIRRLIEPREVVDVALFLLSDAASAVTGATYPVDGGWLGQLSEAGT